MDFTTLAIILLNSFFLRIEAPIQKYAAKVLTTAQAMNAKTTELLRLCENWIMS